MKRKIIHINEDLCSGCGLCEAACHEGAIKMVSGKAKLIRDDYCDGLGDCLPVCPTGAISFEEREAAEYDEAAVLVAKKDAKLPCGCPGTHSKSFKRDNPEEPVKIQSGSMLNQWPVQIELAPPNAAYFRDAHLLVAADCTAYAYGNFHSEFMKNKITLIGCPKLDNEDYGKKLTEIIGHNNIKSVTIVRMEVPCCGGIEASVKVALKNTGKLIPWSVVVISTDGRILEN